MAMKSSDFWDITSCSPLNISRRFGGTYRQARHQRESIIFHLNWFGNSKVDGGGIQTQTGWRSHKPTLGKFKTDNILSPSEKEEGARCSTQCACTETPIPPLVEEVTALPSSNRERHTDRRSQKPALGKHAYNCNHFIIFRVYKICGFLEIINF
jgi:hypothetical protein